MLGTNYTKCCKYPSSCCLGYPGELGICQQFLPAWDRANIFAKQNVPKVTSQWKINNEYIKTNNFLNIYFVCTLNIKRILH